MNFLIRGLRKVLNLLGVQVVSVKTYNQLISKIENNPELKEQVKNLKLRIQKLHPRLASPLVSQQTELADFCLTLSPKENSVILARGVESLPAATALGNTMELDVVCDVLEVLKYEHRVAHRDAPYSVRLIIESAQANMLSQCKHVLTVSPSVTNCLKDIDVSASIMNQWHVSNNYKASPSISEMLEETKKVVVINCLQNEIGPLEEALEGFANAGIEDSICFIAGRINPPEFEQHIRKLIDEPRFGGRVRILGLLNADSYGTLLAHAHAGLVTLDPAIGNHNASFPNRIVDFAAFGIPVCTPALPDILAEPKLDGYLNIVDDVRNPNDWSNVIKSILDEPSTKKPSILAGDDWANGFLETLGDAKNVFIIDNSWGWHGNRIKRQILAILESKREVTYVCRHYTLDENGRRYRHPENPFLVEHFKSTKDMRKHPAWM